MKRSTLIVVFLLLVTGGGGWYYFDRQRRAEKAFRQEITEKFSELNLKLYGLKIHRLAKIGEFKNRYAEASLIYLKEDCPAKARAAHLVGRIQYDLFNQRCEEKKTKRTGDF